MEPNRIKQAVATKTRIRGVHMTFPAPQLVRALASCSTRFLYLDGEHGCFSPEDIEVHCALAHRYGMTPIARVPSNEPWIITHWLDRGAKGIVVPHINNAEEARRAVAATYYAPEGSRTYGGAFPPHRREGKSLAACLAESNQDTTLSVMIESREGLEAIDAIASVPGIDYMSFGMCDLAQSLGHAGNPGHPEVGRAVACASERIRAAGIPVREDIMTFCWIEDAVVAGVQAKLDAASP